MHENPLPLYPVLHVHVNEPGLLEHEAAAWQGEVEHSLLSVKW